MSALPDSPSASPPPRHDELASLIERHTPADGSTATALPGLNFYRSSSPTELNVSFYRPSLALLAQGAKRVQLGDDVYEYDTSHYLLTSFDLPVASRVTLATPGTPYLCFALDLDPHRIAGLKTSYDAGKDLQPVTLAGETPLAVVVNPAVPARTLAELVALARKDPSAISYGTPGTGSTMQFAGEALNLAAGIKMLHVPYRGAAPAIADLLGNQIPVAIVGVPPLVAHHKSGKLRILAVTGSQRIAALPDVPTVAEELGVADYRYTNWFGVYVPGNTPAAVGDRLAALIHASVHRDAIKAQLAEQGVEPIGNTTPEFVRFLADEKARYETVQRKSGIQMD